MIRLDDTSLLSGKAVLSDYSGFGVKGADVPAQSLFYDDVTLPDEAETEFRYEIVTPPSQGTLQNFESGVFFYQGNGNSDSFTYRLYRDNVPDGQDYTVTINGSGSPIVYDRNLTFIALTADEKSANKDISVNLISTARAEINDSTNSVFQAALDLLSQAGFTVDSGRIQSETLLSTSTAVDTYTGAKSIVEGLTFTASASSQYSTNVSYGVVLTEGSNSDTDSGIGGNQSYNGSVTLVSEASDGTTAQAVFNVDLVFGAEGSDITSTPKVYDETLTINSAISAAISGSISDRNPAPPSRTIYIKSERKFATITVRRR